jgi:hypothetical protein
MKLVKDLVHYLNDVSKFIIHNIENNYTHNFTETNSGKIIIIWFFRLN